MSFYIFQKNRNELLFPLLIVNEMNIFARSI